MDKNTLKKVLNETQTLDLKGRGFRPCFNLKELDILVYMLRCTMNVQIVKMRTLR